MPYVGEIKIFAGNFAPAGWMFCEGQLLREHKKAWGKKRAGKAWFFTRKEID